MRKILNEFMAWLPGDRSDKMFLARIKANTTPEVHRIYCAKNGDRAELMIYENIGLDWWTGEGMTPSKLQSELNRLRPFDELLVRMNSNGGDVFDAMAIYNVLRMMPEPVVVEIEAVAASAASYIVQAASPGKLRIHESAEIMIHKAHGMFAGFDTADNMEPDAIDFFALLRKIDVHIADIYAARTGKEASTWLTKMKKDYWMSGKQSVEEGMADEVIPLKKSGKKNETPYKNRIKQLMTNAN